MTRKKNIVTKWALVVFSIALAAATISCSGKDTKQPAATKSTPSTTAPAKAAPLDPAAAMKEAKMVFATVCTTCHGATGAGDGAASANLSPKPRNFTSPEWQKSVTDEHIEKVVVYGGIAVGLSAAMPGNPQLDAKPEVVRALREHIRSLEL